MAPQFSIITPTLNRATMLPAALASVEAQEGASVEHIVVDGGSTDGTLELLARHPRVEVVSGPDGGVYDAINIGLRRSSGAIVGLLNSDDAYAPGAFAAVAAAFAANPEADSVCGVAELVEGDAAVARYDDPRDQRLDAHAVLVGACIPNARFFRRAVFDRIGLFSTDYPHVADRDFLLRMRMRGLVTAPIAAPVYRYGRHAESLTFAAGVTRARRFREELLRFARDVQARPGLPSAFRRKAQALEGRCLVTLSLNDLRRFRLGSLGALRGRASGSAAAAIAAAVVDRWRSRDRL